MKTANMNSELERLIRELNAKVKENDDLKSKVQKMEP